MDVAVQKAQKLVLQLQHDLEKLERGENDNSEFHAQINSSFATLSRQIKNVETISAREIDSNKRQKARERLTGFNQELQALTAAYNKYRRKQVDQVVQKAEREELLQLRSRSTATDQETTIMMDRVVLERESLGHSDRRLDEYIGLGSTILSNLQSQRATLKGTKKRLLDVANSIGLSQSIVRMIERRSGQDWLILFGGIIVTCIIMVVVLYYFA